MGDQIYILVNSQRRFLSVLGVLGFVCVCVCLFVVFVNLTETKVTWKEKNLVKKLIPSDCPMSCLWDIVSVSTWCIRLGSVSLDRRVWAVQENRKPSWRLNHSVWNTGRQAWETTQSTKHCEWFPCILESDQCTQGSQLKGSSPKNSTKWGLRLFQKEILPFSNTDRIFAISHSAYMTT